MTSDSASSTQATSARVVTAIQQLAVANGELANVLAALAAVVAEEALQNPGFGARLSEVFDSGRGHLAADASHMIAATTVASASGGVHMKPRAKRARRAPGPWDPFAVYADVGEAGLREQLSRLELEQLRDIIAEHGMNTDGLAMRWTKPDRVVSRIVDRVVDRAAKGDAFRRA